jgi:hypothetical protein
MTAPRDTPGFSNRQGSVALTGAPRADWERTIAMTSKSLQCAAVAAMVAVATVAGCKKNEPAPPPATTAAAPANTPAPAPAPAAPSVSVTGVDLGTAVGADMRVSVPMTEFGAKDTIIAAVSTQTSGPPASVPGTLSAKWSFQDGQVVNNESQPMTFDGAGVTDFRLSKADGIPAGKYRLDILLDGNLVQTRDFTVK